MRRPRSNSRRPSRKCARASAEEVVMGWLITALVMGSSAERGPCAAAPADQLTDASTSARAARVDAWLTRSEEHTSELQSHSELVCRLLLEKKKSTMLGRLDLSADSLEHDSDVVPT